MIAFTRRRLRNITTNRLHTTHNNVREDLGKILGGPSIATGTIGPYMRAVTPWLKKVIHDPTFWNGMRDNSSNEIVELPEPTKDERKAMFTRYWGERGEG